MKKFALFIMLCFTLTACSVNDEGGTYYPDSNEMKANLENAGYTVTVTEDFSEQYSGTYLSAEKGDDYIEFYRLEQAEAVAVISDELEEKHQDYDKFVSMENDERFGTLVFCGTGPAVDSSGINIVDVKV